VPYAALRCPASRHDAGHIDTLASPRHGRRPDWSRTPAPGWTQLRTGERIPSSASHARAEAHTCPGQELRRLSKQGNLPSINTLVDIGNVVSIRYAMPVAVFDLAGIAGLTTVRFATGAERFTDLGSSASVHPDPGEVIFVDGDDVVSARRWCWRQSAQSATSATTVEALIVVEGNHDDAGRDVAAALADLTALLAAHQPRSGTASYLLTPADPTLPTPYSPTHDRIR
jgi:hypothetical protein